MNNDSDVTRPPIFEAGFLGDLEQFKALVDEGGDWTVTDGYKRTVLHWASYKKFIDLVAYILHLSKKANKLSAHVNQADIKGKPPLHFAVQSGCTEIVELLLNGGANINATNIAGLTALHYATFNADKDLCVYLCEHGASVKASNQEGQTALHYSCQTGNLDLVKYLVQKKANVNALTKEHHLPLHFAVAYKHFPIVKELLDSHSVLPKSILEIETSSEIDDYLEEYILGNPTSKKSKPSLSVDTTMEPMPIPSVLQTPITPSNIPITPKFGLGEPQFNTQ